ncbi:MAG: tRNA epoxyqueuosine(34) reductase QueG [Myxococcota bacterium]
MADPATQPDPVTAAAWVKSQARALGFDDVGIARADLAPDAHHFRRALAEGRMDPIPYLSERVPERCDPRVLLPGARSVVVVMMGYLEPRPEPPAEPHLKVARYAARRDYHNPFIKRLRSLRGRLRAEYPGTDAYVAADTGAVLERSWARAAGLGWIGKNAMLLSRTHGTYTLLGSLITTLELAPDAPFTADHCGTCTRCLDACPTGALTEARTLDARRCITAFNVECFDDELPPHAPPLHDWVFGCDICQEVCPWGSRGVLNPQLASRAELAFIPTSALDSRATVASLPELTGTPLARAGVKRLQRNARARQKP